MPLYEYECEACGHRFELIRKFSDEPLAICEACGKGPVNKLPSSPAIQFKGSGFYITDYAQKGRSDGSVSAGKTERDRSEKNEKGEKSEPAKTATSSTTDASSSSSSASSSSSTASSTSSSGSEKK